MANENQNTSRGGKRVYISSPVILISLLIILVIALVYFFVA
ncbi:MAG: hypothetical protein JWN76_2971 [Chitinophagaceae bacterium]|nr:hypothetical protein [Chitinophagaceae bacterium]